MAKGVRPQARQGIRRPTRRDVLAAAGAGALALGLAACAGLPFSPGAIEISQEQLFSQLAGQFPFNQRMLDLFDVTVAAPRFRLLPQENRIGTELDVTAGQAL